MLRQFLVTLAAVSVFVTTAVPSTAQNVSPVQGPKSEHVALALSLIGTALPLYVGATEQNGLATVLGAFVGPSLGYFYAGRVGRGIGGVALRFGVIALAGLGALAACGSILWGCDNPTLSNGIVLAGGVALLASAIYDVVGGQRAVRQWNAAHAEQRVTLTPHVDAARRAVGVKLRIAF